MHQNFKTEIKLFLLVAIIAVVVSAAGVLLLRELSPAPVAQTPPPPVVPSSEPLGTSDWQVHHREFELEYPEDWQTHFKQYSNGDILTFTPISEGEIWGKVYIKDIIDLTISENTQAISLDEYTASFVSNKLIDIIISLEDITVADIPGKKVFYRRLSEGPYSLPDEVYESIFILRGDKVYEWMSGELTDEGRKAWDQILSTFRFVEK